MITGKIGWNSSNQLSLSTYDVRRVIKEVRIPEGKTSPIYDVKSRVFMGAAKLTSIPETLFANCTEVRSFLRCFEECTNLAAIPDKLFENCTNVTSFDRCFTGCSQLTAIPENLFKNCTKVIDFTRCFFYCTNISSTVPKLWELYPKAHSVYCFYHCPKISNLDEIPLTWINQYS